jgi:FRG domain-containing protein
MARYQIIEQDDSLHIPIRYDNFASLNAQVEPPVPWSVVPLHRNIADAVTEAKGAEAELTQKLYAMGLHRMGPRSAHQIGYADKINFPFRIFRGERSLRFNIMPTRFRFSGQPDPAGVTRQRIQFETRCAERMREYLRSNGAPEASIEHARAAARHHGCPSSFVDFSFNPEVAAFFAHPAFNSTERERGADIGILYSLGIEDFEHLFGGLAAWTVPAGGGRDVRYINIKSVWQIPYKSFDPAKGTIEDATLAVKVPDRLVVKPVSIRTRIVSVIARIAAQEGIFIDGCFEDADDWWSQVLLWTVLDFASGKSCFLREDFAYENSAAGITTAKLFPPLDPELAELTRDFGSSFMA